MALLQYFKLKKERQHLPNPNGPLSVKVPSSGIAAANLHVSKLLDKTNTSVSSGEAGTRGPCAVFTPAQKYEIGKKAAEMGTTSAMHYYDKNYPDLAKKPQYGGLRTCTTTKLRNRFIVLHVSHHW